MFDLNHLHPMIVHFPIALLFVGFLADAIGLILKKNFSLVPDFIYSYSELSVLYRHIYPVTMPVKVFPKPVH